MTTQAPQNQKSETLIAAMPSAELREIAEAVVNGERLSPTQALTLLTTEHENAVGALADYARRERVGDTVYYASTLFIHPTNLCELSCPLCSFYAKPGWKTAWFRTPEQIEASVREHYPKGLTEIHVVGGLWRDCNLDYYQEMFTRIKAIDPALHIKALTPVEYDFLAKLHGISIEEVFARMMEWGLGSLPGGGAEILVESVRKQIAPQKITSDEYLEVHRIAHRRGLHSNITMLFGHVEDPQDIVTHLCKVRELQDDTGGFQTFVPLRYHDENNALGKRKKRLKPKEPRRIYAVARLMLDNVRNLKILWNYLGIQEAQQMLNWGGNDFASTALDEKIITMAGGIQVKMTSETIESLINSMKRRPYRIHSGHDYSKDVIEAC
jgi:aminodeoxyfutalosine synthase